MSWWKSLFGKRFSDAQTTSELSFHIDELTEANIAEGMTAEEARRRAILEFGGQEQVKQDLRDVYRIRFVDATLANLKSALRFIRKSPAFGSTNATSGSAAASSSRAASSAAISRRRTSSYGRVAKCRHATSSSRSPVAWAASARAAIRYWRFRWATTTDILTLYDIKSN